MHFLLLGSSLTHLKACHNALTGRNVVATSIRAQTVIWEKTPDLQPLHRQLTISAWCIALCCAIIAVGLTYVDQWENIQLNIQKILSNKNP